MDGMECDGISGRKIEQEGNWEAECVIAEISEEQNGNTRCLKTA